MIETIKEEYFDNELEISKKQLLNLNLFWIGFVTYVFAFSFSDLGHQKLFQVLQLASLLLIFWGIISLVKFKVENSYLQILYVLYGLWFIFLIFQDIHPFFSKDFLLYFWLNPFYGGMLYFVPAILLFPKKLIFYKRAFDVIVALCIIYILFDLIFIKDLISSDHSNLLSQELVETSFDLSIPCGFILLTYKYHSNKRKLLAIVTILLTLFFAIVRARRGLILMTSLLMLFSYLLYFIYSKNKVFIFYFSIVIITVVSLYAVNIYNIKTNRVFSFVAERADEDTRTGVEFYFYEDMKPMDWIIGRGINGKYYCPNVDEDEVSNYRSVIETGYLQIILKGGVVSLGLLLLITVPAIFKGIFYSSNILSKAAGIWILLALLSLYPATVDTFSMRYILMWISVGICYSKEIRNIPDSLITAKMRGED
jgi:hypothetical protein